MNVLLHVVMIIIAVLAFRPASASQQPLEINLNKELSGQRGIENEPGGDVLTRDNTATIQELLKIQNKYRLSKENLYYFEINVLESSMDVYRLVQEKNGMYSLDFISSHRVGTPKVKEYPRGFGLITQVERNPIWAPTPSTVKEFKKRGIDLTHFSNKEGKIIVPAGSPLNYMGPVKMRISFVTPQKSAKTRREVYRIHGILPKLKGKLGTRCSGGCIRVDNDEIKELVRLTRKSSIVVRYI